MTEPTTAAAEPPRQEGEDPIVALGKGLVPAGYLRQGLEAGLGRRRAALRRLLEHRRLPEEGWDDATIEGVLYDLAMMDSNNFPDNVGVGEREARVFSRLVRARHGHFGHGMGRSGDVQEPQPKAAGSSLLVQLTNLLALDALRTAGLTRMAECAVLPLATGMAMALTLLTLANQRRQQQQQQQQQQQEQEGASSSGGATAAPSPSPNLVLWPRIDQKSCLKAILTAGLTPVPLPLLRDGDELRTDVPGLRAQLEALGGATRVLCVLSTTSCFAPRVPDAVQDIAALCQEFGVPHVVNNAYGLQCSKATHALNEACRTGRVDLVVQSTDKNFLVPVGGAVVAGPGAGAGTGAGAGKRGAGGRAPPGLVPQVCKMYPGRAGSAPVQDLFITLLSMGKGGYLRLLRERKALAAEMSQGLAAVAERHGLRLLQTPRNTISFAVTLKGLVSDDNDGQEGSGAAVSAEDISFLGSMLFTRCVSGTRVVVPSDAAGAAGGEGGTGKDPTAKTIGPLTFPGYGSHADAYAPGPYLTAACALGVSKDEIDEFLRRLDKTLGDFARRRAKGRREGK